MRDEPAGRQSPEEFAPLRFGERGGFCTAAAVDEAAVCRGVAAAMTDPPAVPMASDDGRNGDTVAAARTRRPSREACARADSVARRQGLAGG